MANLTPKGAEFLKVAAIWANEWLPRESEHPVRIKALAALLARNMRESQVEVAIIGKSIYKHGNRAFRKRTATEVAKAMMEERG